jgi:hypothetical protein
VNAQPDRAALLQRFAPCLRYDSLEGYFADSAEEWTANPGNRLKRGDGSVLATAGDGLSLDFLDAERYANGEPVEDGDYIETAKDDYSRQYAALRAAHPEFRNLVYGRATPAGDELWLQYWFFYFLNDYQLAWGVDVHEGDWEMIQLRLPARASEPDAAVYAQHTFCEIREWGAVRRLADEKREAGDPVQDGDAERPLVYAGRGSHASFFEPGYHPTDFYDVTDGRRRPTTGEARLVPVDDDPSWLRWPGRWGGERTGYAGPSAPRDHPQWTDPRALLKNARTQTEKPAPHEPHLGARRRRQRLLLEFDFSAMTAPPKRLVATVNSIDERDTPPFVYRFALTTVVRGTLETSIPLEAAKHYDVSVSVIDAEDRPTAAQTFLFAPSAGLRGLLGRLGSAFGRLVYLVRLALGARQ